MKIVEIAFKLFCSNSLKKNTYTLYAKLISHRMFRNLIRFVEKLVNNLSCEKRSEYYTYYYV